MLAGAQLKVTPCYFGGQRDKNIPLVFHRGREVGLGRLNLPPVTAKDIDLPTGVKIRLEQILGLATGSSHVRCGDC